MKFLTVLALAAAVLADKDVMLKENRVVADTITTVGTSCETCQDLIRRFVAASEDKVKMAELQMILRPLCATTSYKEECEVFVANLPNMITKLKPWLANEAKVCKNIHLCGNNKLDAFRKIGMLYVKRYMDEAEGLKDLVCDECQMAVREVRVYVQDKDRQKQIRDFISREICTHAGSHRGMCDMVVEQFLPELFQELDVILADAKKACGDLGFCHGYARPAKLVGIIGFISRL